MITASLSNDRYPVIVCYIKYTVSLYKSRTDIFRIDTCYFVTTCMLLHNYELTIGSYILISRNQCESDGNHI